MHYHSQNLSDGKRPIWMYGRAWLKKSKTFDEILHWEWSLFKMARDFSIEVSFGTGECEDGVLFHICIPWLFSIFIGINGIRRCDECSCGVAIHNNSFWVYPLSYRMRSAEKGDPWYRRTFAWDFPWQLDWYSTEVLEQNTRELAQPIWLERKGDRKRLGIDSFKMMDSQRAAAADVTQIHDYKYTLKNGNMQQRKASVHVTRTEWRARWWPIIPIKKVSTCIDVVFNEEVGEGVSGWKGGCVGCGYEMLPKETPLECLRRMERDRKFAR